MGDLSLRDVATRCLDLSDDISVNADVYGYIYRNSDGSLFGNLENGDLLPGTGEPTTRSLRRHLETVSGAAVDVCMILVAHELVTLRDANRTQYGIQVARDVFAQVDFGIRKIIWRSIAIDESFHYFDIRDSDEAMELTQHFSGPHGSIDVYMVGTIENAGGWGPGRRGPCNKDRNFRMTGVVVAHREATGLGVGHAIAHEIGHYLGLGHEQTEANLMCGTPWEYLCSDDTTLTPSQAETMKSHRLVHPPC